jgi:hypothetical protein
MADREQYADDLNRYAMSFAQPHEILGALKDTDRWPSEAISGNRAGAADFLAEAGRHAESELLKNPGRHVLIRDGKVQPAMFVEDHVLAAYDRALEHLHDWSGGAFRDPGIEVERFGNRYRPEDFVEPPGPIPPHHVRVVHLDQTGSEPHTHSDVHFSDLGSHLADALDYAFVPDDFGLNDDGEFEHHAAEHERLLKAVREAPFERFDPVVK